MGLPCQATIDLRALRANFRVARELAGRREVIAVVKADGYGHGAESVSTCLVEAGCEWLAVLTVPEGVALRDAGLQAPILVLAGARSDEEARAVVSRGLTPTLHDSDGARRIEAAASDVGGPVGVQVEIDTGMSRMGVSREAAVPFLSQVCESARLELGGVFTHFARADEPDLQPSLDQIEQFREVLQEARARGIEPPLIHAENSAALLCGKPLSEALPEATAVRPGLMLYGVRPAAHLEAGLEPVMTLRASVLAVRDVAPGSGVGYGATWRAPAGGTRVATLSLGYADGIPWASGGRGHVWLGGARLPIVGRVSMDSISVDLGLDSRVAVGDEAVLFGEVPEDEAETSSRMLVEDAARDAGTLHYELLVRVGARVPRVVVD